MAKKTPGWLVRLSAPVRASVLASAQEAGFAEHEMDQWCADTLTTAFRSPQGIILRLKRKPLPDTPSAIDAPELPL